MFNFAEISCLVLYFCLLGASAQKATFRQLAQDKLRQHLSFGCAISLLMLWSLKAGLFDELQIHFLCLTGVTLMLGWRTALWTASLALLLLSGFGKEPWPLLGINGLLGVVLPIAVSWGVLQLANRYLPKNIFVFIFVAAFFNAALAISARHLAYTGFYLLSDNFTFDQVFDNFFILWPLLLFPEALLNGMLVTLLVIYKPDWISTFNDKEYLK